MMFLLLDEFFEQVRISTLIQKIINSTGGKKYHNLIPTQLTFRNVFPFTPKIFDNSFRKNMISQVALFYERQGCSEYVCGWVEET